jgi:hypothetical protein
MKTSSIGFEIYKIHWTPNSSALYEVNPFLTCATSSGPYNDRYNKNNNT